MADTIEYKHLPTQLVYDEELQSGQDPEWEHKHADKLLWDFDSLCRIYLVMQTNYGSSCPGGWSQIISDMKVLNVEVMGWCIYMWPVC